MRGESAGVDVWQQDILLCYAMATKGMDLQIVIVEFKIIENHIHAMMGLG